jgi:hypothetical protein
MSPANPGGTLVDRRQYLLGAGVTWNGVDYVEVATEDQTTLRVHFLNTVTVAGTLGGTPGSPPGSPPPGSAARPVTITGGEVIASVAVLPIDEATDWSVDSEARPVLTVRVKAPGDFSTYRLGVVSSVLDPFFASVPFSFKAGCPSDFDCAKSPAPCPPPEALDVAIDYLAKDFRSFVQALWEFSTQRYPAWLERSEADVGMVVMEVLAAMADELSYFQDRIAGESALATATQPLSLLHLARLVDYEPAPATVATVLLQLDVAGGTTAITTPVHCQALAAGGGLIDFEVGQGLADPATGGLAALALPVDARWNRYRSGVANLVPYWWDESQACLPAGATSFDLLGWGFGLTAGQSLLIDTAGPTSADPPVREVVVSGPVPQELLDPVFGVQLTRVTLVAPTQQDHDLTRTIYAGNLVPATQGLRTTETFAIPGPAGASPPPGAAEALVRLGANWSPEEATPDYRYCLGRGPLAWIPGTGSDADTAEPARPEIVLLQDPGAAAPLPWPWVRWLLDAGAGDPAFTLTPEQYSPVLSAAGVTWSDYDGGAGTTVRFGDGTFGSLPAPGLTFEVVYRVSGGAAGNVPAGTITIVAAGGTPSPVVSCTNPFPATGGTNAETPQQIRDRAPQAFRNLLSVVGPSDYVAAAQSLPWVRQAGTTFRWTGSWLTVLSAADPVATEQPTLPEVAQLTDLLNRRRLAGYESYVLPPRYVSVDLHLTLCANPAYFGADVEAAVLRALRPGPLPGGQVGFFDHTRRGFGAPLESSALLAAVQACIGVDGVTRVLFRQRGVQTAWAPLPETLTVGADQILRVDDDPSRPEAGSLKVIVNGGKA